jgi:hypothetical protein
MTGLRRSGRLVAAVALACTFAAAAHAQGRPPVPLVYRSAHGTLVGVDATAGTILMKTDEGKTMAWKFDAAVTGQLGAYKKGDPVVVIYRLRGADKAVTAVAFPGTADRPVYVNTSEERVQIVGGPLVNGACGQPSDVPLSTTTIPAGGQAVVADACWCCAPAGEACIPGNKTGNGQAFLARCFK